MLLGDDLLPWLLFAFGAAMAVGSALALIRPPRQQEGGDVPRPPLGRSIVMIGLGSIAAVWAAASLVAK